MSKKYIYGNRYENRVRVSNDAELSNASLTIDQLTMGDNGTYECSVSLMSDQDVNAKSRVRLLVLGECLCLFLWEEGGQRSAVSSSVMVLFLPLGPNALRVLSGYQAVSEGRDLALESSLAPVACSPPHQLFFPLPNSLLKRRGSPSNTRVLILA